MGQYTLGVLTLINYVPIELGTAHQAGALTLWTMALWVLHSLRPASAALKAAGGGGTPQAKAALAVAATAASIPVMAAAGRAHSE